MNEKKLMNRAADNIRILAASMVEKANSGHPGGAMGGADFVNVLFSEFLVYDPENPRWEGRDRFFLDPGHIVVIAVRTVNVDAVAPAGDLQAVIAHLGRQRTQFIEGQVRPLAGAKSYRSVSHDTFLLLKS